MKTYNDYYDIFSKECWNNIKKNEKLNGERWWDKNTIDDSNSAEVKGSIKNGFCTKETQKECLEAFKAEFIGMVEAIDALLNS